MRFSGFGSASFVACVLGLVLCAGVARGYDYRVPIEVDSEDDVYELLSAGDISTTESEQLIAMLHDPLDLNSASRDDLYNLPGISYVIADRIIERRDDKPFTRIRQLLDVDGVTEEVFDEGRPFMRIVPPRTAKVPKKDWKVRQRIKVQAVDRIKDEKLRGGNPLSTPWSQADDDFPETYTLLEARIPEKGYSIGAAVLTQNSVAAPVYVNKAALTDYAGYKSDWRSATPKSIVSNGPYLWTDGLAYQPSWPKVYAMIERNRWKLLAGSYNVGFGQRVVFDTTGLSTPHGFRPDLYAGVGDKGVTFPASKSMFGVVGTLRGFDLGGVKVEATPFFSWWRHDLYFQHVAQRDVNNDKHSYTLLTDPTEDNFGQYYRSLYYQYPTLPRAYDELIGGGNVTLHLSPRFHAGVTGYARQVWFRLDDPDATFVDHVSQPDRELLYVVGGDVKWGLGKAGPFDKVTLFAEGAVMDNGAFAVFARSVMEVGKEWSIEPSYRFYSKDYDNPHSRMPSQDEFFDGNRDRAEHGGRLSVRYRPLDWLQIRLDQDAWQVVVHEWTPKEEEEGVYTASGPSLDPIRLDSYLSVDVRPVQKLRIGGYVNRVDKDADASGRDESYSNYDGNGDMQVNTLEGGTDSGTGKKITGRGEKWKFGGYVATKFIPHTNAKAMYNRSFADVQKNSDRFGSEHYGALELTTRPLGFLGKQQAPLLTLKGRFKYFEGQMVGEDLQEDDERFWMAYVQAGTVVKKRYMLTLRGAMINHLDVVNDQGEPKDSSPSEYFWKAMFEMKF